MKKQVTITNFIGDRCHTTEERNIDKHSGIIYTLEAKKCEDMRYGNSTIKTIDLCKSAVKSLVFLCN